jgi:hypothetical protein
LLNKELLYNYIANNKIDNSEIFNEIKEENRQLIDKISNMFNEKTILEKKVNLNLI